MPARRPERPVTPRIRPARRGTSPGPEPGGCARAGERSGPRAVLAPTHRRAFSHRQADGRSSAQTTLQICSPSVGYQPHRVLNASTTSRPRPLPDSNPVSMRNGGCRLASPATISSQVASETSHSHTGGDGGGRYWVAAIAVLTRSLFTELPTGFPQLRGHAGGFGVRDFYLRAGYVLLPCSRRLRSPVTS